MKAQTIATRTNENASAGPAPGRPSEGRVPDQIIQQRRIKDGGSIELLPGDGGADDGENSRADHRADAERSQRNRARGSSSAALGLFGVGDQLVDGFAAEQAGFPKYATGAGMARRRWLRQAVDFS